MQEFETYVKSNYNIPNAVSCGITYTYTKQQRTNKKSSTVEIVHTINMKLSWFDSSNHQLDSSKLTFQNDTLTKASEKQCKTINPSDTTNKFRIAKQEIVQQLTSKLTAKIAELQSDVNSLHTYMGSNSSIIPQTMKPVLHLTRVNSSFDPASPKQTLKFDM